MDKARAFRIALQAAKTDYGRDTESREILARVIAYLTVKVKEHVTTKAVYKQLPMFVVVGALTGNYHCTSCGRSFGENTVSPLQSKRAYHTLHCPHCFESSYQDYSQ